MVMITNDVEYSYSSHGIHDQDWCLERGPWSVVRGTVSDPSR